MKKSKTLTPGAIYAQVIDGRTVRDWEKWHHLPDWQTANSPDLRGNGGLIRFRRNGEVVFISRAVPKGGGIRKRLRDFTRPSSSGRNHYGGRLVHQHRDELEVDILVTGNRYKTSVINVKLQSALRKIYLPAWNVSRMC